MIELNFNTAVESLKNGTCPFCSNGLNYDVQMDSIYVSCGCGNFEVSTFRDKFNGALLLYYLNNGDEGGVNQANLKELQNILYRNNDIKKQLFTMEIKSRIF